MGFQVFVSHSTKDLTLVYQLKNCLEQNGVHAYLAEIDLQPGQDLPDKIKKAIDQSDCVLALLTADGMPSEFVQQEIGYAEKGQKLVIPVVETGLQPPGFLIGKEYIPLSRVSPERTVIKATEFLVKKKTDKENRDKIVAGLLILFGLWALSKLTANEV